MGSYSLMSKAASNVSADPSQTDATVSSTPRPPGGMCRLGLRPLPPAAVPDSVVQRHQVEPVVGVPMADHHGGQRPGIVQPQLGGDTGADVDQDPLSVALDEVAGRALAGVRPRRAAAEHGQRQRHYMPIAWYPEST